MDEKTEFLARSLGEMVSRFLVLIDDPEVRLQAGLIIKRMVVDHANIKEE